MKILLFGITNVGKSTIGKLLSEKLDYEFDDLDEEIKRRYGKIDAFMNKYPWTYERHKRRGKILSDIVNKYEDNAVIAVSSIFYVRCFSKLLEDENILAIELQDKPENILKRLVYADEDDNVFPLEITTEKERKYYLSDIKKDITFFKRTYAKITNKFDMNGEEPETVTERLAKYIEDIKNGIEPIKNENKDEIIMGFKVYRG